MLLKNKVQQKKNITKMRSNKYTLRFLKPSATKHMTDLFKAHPKS